jgi:hypothetical protein
MHSAQKSRTTELLHFLVLSTVAIAIDAVLFPVLDRAKESGDRVVAAKMDDLRRALAEYSQDNDALLPSGSCPNTVTFLHSNTGVGWAGQVYLYDPNFRDFDDGLGQTLRDRRRGTIVSFAYNRNAVRNSDEGSWPVPELHGGSMYLLADGHAEWMPPSKVSSGFDAVVSDALQTGAATVKPRGLPMHPMMRLLVRGRSLGAKQEKRFQAT